jgi:hypothetical protein
MNTDETAPIYTQQQLEEHIRIVHEAEARTREEILADAFALRIRRGLVLLLLGGWIGYLLGQS